MAADAVVEEPQFKTSLDKSHILEDLHFYEGGNHPHGFSPPVETEGRCWDPGCCIFLFSLTRLKSLNWDAMKLVLSPLVVPVRPQE